MILSITLFAGVCVNSLASQSYACSSDLLAPRSMLELPQEEDALKDGVKRSWFARTRAVLWRATKVILVGSIVLLGLYVTFVPVRHFEIAMNRDLLRAPPKASWTTHLSTFVKRQQLTSEWLHRELSPLEKEIKRFVPGYSSSMEMYDSFGGLTFEGIKVLAAHSLLVEEGKAKPFDDEFYIASHTQDILKVRVWQKVFKQAPKSGVINSEKVESLEKEKSLGAFYHWVERFAEPSIFVDRIRDVDTLETYFKDSWDVSFDSFKDTYDQYFEILWTDLAEKSPYLDEGDKGALRDYGFTLAIYQNSHRYYDDSYMVEGITNGVPFHGLRKTLGRMQGASLGMFQGYEKRLAEVYASHPNLVEAISKNSDQEVKDLATRWKGKSESEIEKDLESGEFWYGMSSPLSSHWRLSLASLMLQEFDYYEEAAKLMKEVGIRDPNLIFSIALSCQKSKIFSIRRYLRKTLPSLLKSNHSGYVEIPFDRAHFYLHILEIMKKGGHISKGRQFLFYYPVIGASASQENFSYMDPMRSSV